MTIEVRRPAAVASAAELLGRATARTALRPADGLSAVPMERVLLDGERLVVKWLSPEIDWVMRFSGDDRCRPVVMWEEGLYHAVSPWVDPLVTAVARDEERGAWALVMRDATEEFLPEGDATIPPDAQKRFLRDMAGLHAGFWGFEHREGLCRPEQFYGIFAPSTLAKEAAERPLTGVPSYAGPGWEELRALQPQLTEQVLALAEDPQPLVRALAETPRTLVHHDWKGGNLGTRPDGRTVLVDWAFPGASAGCADLAWYLGVNCDRLPTGKEGVISAYREALERNGIRTAPWFDRQLELALLGCFLVLGWSKTQDPAELRWWVDRTARVAAELCR